MCTALACRATGSVPVKLSFWPLTKPNIKRLQSNDRVMVDRSAVSSKRIWPLQGQEKFLSKLELEDLDLFLRERGGLEMWSILVGQSEQHVIYRLMESAGHAGPR